MRRTLAPEERLMAFLDCKTPLQPQCWLWDFGEAHPHTPWGFAADRAGDGFSRLWDELAFALYRWRHRAQAPHQR